MRVVGVAIIRDGAVLAARRTAPAAVAGGWELPGGKCEAGESLADAAVREIAEELGCEIRVTGTVSGSEVIAEGLTLEVVTAELVAGEPMPTEHDAIRWLRSDELHDVRWLPADVPFLAELGRVLGS
jgi:8-oxo-dGTP diphosphatase